MILYLAYFVVFFSLLQLTVAFVNWIFKPNFRKQKTENSELVSILIPARNEENNIEILLSDLQKQNYNNIEIIVFNDQSTDKTDEIISAKATTDKRIYLINGQNLPSGWLGKNNACFQLAKKAKGQYFLFLDADVRISGNIINQTIGMMKTQKLGLISIFPKQIMNTLGEWFSVPNMNYILLSLLPLILVRKTKISSLSAANGQFMLFNAKVYNKTQPHEQMKREKVEDIKIAQFFKKRNLKISCLTGNNDISCRMYPNYKEAISGFAKNVAMFFGNSLLVAFLFWLMISLGFLLILTVLPFSYLILYLVSILLIRILVSLTSQQNVFKNLIYLIPQQITLGLFIAKALIYKLKKEQQWKGRNIL